MTPTPKKDHSLVKGTVVAAAATAILLGGFGTFALWNDSATVSINQSLRTAELRLGTPAAGRWELFDHSGMTKIDPATFLASPGDVVRYVTTVPVTFNASHGKAFLVASSLDVATADGAENYVSTHIELNDGEGPLEIGPYNGVQSVPVAVNVTFSKDATDLQGLDDLITLSDLKLTLTQNYNDGHAPTFEARPAAS